MKKIFAYILSPITIFLAIVFLCIFDLVQRVCLVMFGYSAHKKSVDVLNWLLLKCAHISGATFRAKGQDKLPLNEPIVLVSNHQSLYDIVCIVWFLRRVHPKFISKIELAKNIPSVSYNLRKGGSVAIDRKDPRQAIPQIKKIAEYIEKNKRAATIFPEGTRSRTGQLKPFSKTGLQVLYKHAPNAYFVPITINNSWKILPKGLFPLGLGARVSVEVHEPFKVSEYSFEEIFEKTHQAIASGLKK